MMLPSRRPTSWICLFLFFLLCSATLLPAQRASRNIGVLVLEGDTITDVNGGFVVEGSPTINGVILSSDDINVRGSVLSTTGTLSITNVTVLGEVELLSGDLSVNTATGKVPDVSRLTSRLNVGGMKASLGALDILSNGVSVTGTFTVRGQEFDFDGLSITSDGVAFTEGKLTLGGIDFDAQGGNFTREGVTIESVEGAVKGATIGLTGLSAGGDKPFDLTGGSIKAAGLTAAFEDGNILPDGISIGTASITGLPRSASFSVANLVATESEVAIGSGEVAIGSFNVSLSDGDFSGSGVTVANAQMVAGGATVVLNGFAASNAGATIADGSVQVSGMTLSLTGFTFQQTPESLVIERAELAVRNTTDFVIEGFAITPTGQLRATGGSFRAGGVEASLRGPDFRSDHIRLQEATLSAAGQSLLIRGLEVRSTGATIGEGDAQVFGGRLDFTNGTFNTGGFAVGTAELDIDNIRVLLTSFAIMNNGISIGGGSFTWGGFSVTFSSTPVSDGGLEIAASLQLPPSFGGAGAAVDFVIRNGHITVESGEIDVPDFKIPATPIGLRDIVIQFNRTDINGSGTVDLPTFSITAGVGLRNGRFSSFTIQGDNMNVAIGDTGAFLQTVGVSGKYLDRVEVCANVPVPHAVHYPTSSGMVSQILELAGWITQNRSRYSQDIGLVYDNGTYAAGYYTVENRCWIPPLTFGGTVGASAGPTVLGQAFVRANTSSTFDSAGNFEIDGNLYALFLRLGSAFFRVQHTGLNKGVALGGDVVWDLIIDGSGNVAIDTAKHVSGDADVALKVPDGVPVIGGFKFGDVDLGFNNDSIHGAVKVVVKVAFTIRNGEFHLNKQQLRPWEIPYTYDLPLASTASLSADKALAQSTGATLSVLTNFRRADRWYASAAAEKALVERMLTVPAGRDAIIRLHYANAAGNPATELVGPDGTVYTADAFALDQADAEQDVHYRAVPGAREGNWLLRDVPPGPDGRDPVYTVRVVNAETLGEYVVEVLSERDPSFATDVAGVTDGATIRIDASAFDPDSDARVDVLLTRERGQRRGIFLARDLPEVDGPFTSSHDLATSPIQTGSYYPAIRVSDGNTGEHWAWAERPLFVASATAPLTVTDVRAYSTPDGIVVSWTPLADPLVYSYNVLWGDVRTETGFPHALGADASQRQVLLPSTLPSREYRINVVALRATTLTGGQLALRHQVLRDAALAAASGSANAKSTVTRLASAKGIGLQAAEVDALAEQARLVAAGLDARAVESLPAPDSNQTKGGDLLDLYSAGPLGGGTSLITLLGQGNNVPHIIGTPPTTAIVGTPWEAVLEAIDAEGHTMTAKLDVAPTSMTLTVLDSQPGYLKVAVRWTPTDTTIGRVRVGLEFTDSQGGAIEERFSLFVGDTRNEELGRVVLLSPLPSTTAIAGRPYDQAIQARVTRGLPALRYRLVAGPTGLEVTADGRIRWQAVGPAAIGTHPVVVEVFQEGSEAAQPATLSFTLTVRRSALVGDVDGNGLVEAADKQALSDYLAGRRDLSGGTEGSLDLNNDGAIDAADMVAFEALVLPLD